MEKTYTIDDWIQAYQEKVRDILGYQGYTVKSSSRKMFEKLVNMYSDVSPPTFMESVFDPNIWWGTPKKSGGWIKLKYPYPNMLTGEKSAEIYRKYVKDRKPEKLDKEQEILGSVSTSLDKIFKLGIRLTDLHDLYYLTRDGTISPYIFASLGNSYSWVVLQSNQGEIDMEWLKELDKTNKYLNEHMELQREIAKLLEEYGRRDN